MRTWMILAAGVVGAAGLAATAMAGPTLDAAKKRGSIQCGVNTGLAGLADLV